MNELTQEYQLEQELTIRQLKDFMDAHGTVDMADVGGAGYEERLALFGWFPDVYDLIEGKVKLDICKNKLPKEYRTIICCNTFEHILDPFGAAQNIIKSLKPGGYLFLTTVWIYPYHAYRDVPDTFRYTSQSLSLLFQDLQEVKCWYENENHPDGAIRVSYIGKKKPL